MKKVLFTATVDSHILNFHIPYLKYFKEQGYEVHVATNGDEEIPYCDKKIKISFERSPYKLNNLRAIKQLKKVIMEEKYDIIHTHTPMGSVVTRLAAIKARKKYHTRVIYTAHGFHFYKGAPKKNWLLFYPVEKFLSKYTDILITINKEDYNLAKNKFTKCKDIQYVPGVGIDENKFNIKMTKKEKSELRKTLELKDDDFVMIYVARMDINKNQVFLIDVTRELIKENKNIHLLLVGPDENHGIYQKQAQDILQNVHFLGYRKDISKLMNISNVAVSSSLREGLPVNIMEAMIVGLPVVATDARGVRDLIINGVNGYVVEVNNKEEFIKRVYDVQNGFINLNKKTNEISNKYKISNIIAQIDKIYCKKKKLMFIHGGAMTKESDKGNIYCGGSYSKDIWERYYSIADEVIVLFRRSNKIYSDNELKNNLQLFYKKNKLIKIENISESKNPIRIIQKVIVNIKIIKNNVINSDIIVARVPSFVSYIAIKYAKKYNKNLLVEVVGCGFDSLWNHSLFGKILAIPEMLLQKYYVRYAPNVLYVSNEFLQKRYPTKGNNIGCSDVVISSISNKDLKSRIKRIEKINLRKDKIILGTVGNINIKYKGHKYILKSINKLKKIGFNIEYQLVGGGSDEKLHRLIQKYELEENVKILGTMNHEDVLEWYKKIDIYVQPSTVEGLCRSIIEAMNTGCPCIVSTAGGNTELIESTYIFKKRKYKDFIRVFCSINNENLLYQIVLNKEKAKEYDIKKLNDLRNNFYEDCLVGGIK